MKSQRAVQSIEVGGQLLLALARHPAPMALKDLAAEAGLSASRAHPYLVSFGRLELIEQDPASGRYALGPAALQIGLACLVQSDPMKAATPVAEALAARTGHAVALAVWGNFGPTVVRMIDGREPVHVSMRAGTVMSVAGTATGRAFAAVLPAKTLEQAMRGTFGELRGAAPDAAAKAAAECEQGARDWRAHGLTRAVGRPIPGVNAFSAPVLGRDGEVALAITALGPRNVFPTGWDSAPAQAVRAAAAEISRRLGYRGERASGVDAVR